jgi:hypothetical protein
MQTGWIHKDHETQREFERLRNKATASVEQTPAVEQPTVQRSAATQLPQKEYDLNSPLGTITVDAQKGTNKITWSIERPLTFAINDIDIPSRIADNGTFRVDTVNRLRFIAGSNIVIYGRNYDKDVVDVEINATNTTGLEGSLSTVWIKDANQDIPTSVGYNTITGQYVTELIVGPWGFVDGVDSTTPVAASGYSNIAKDSEWDWGTTARINANSAYTRMGRVSKSGLYWVYGTAQGYKWVSWQVDNNLIPFVNHSVHYYCMVRRATGNPESPYSAVSIYKPLDTLRWDEWIGTNLTGEERQQYRSVFSSLPWSLNGGCNIWLNAGDEVAHMVTFYGGNGGETRMLYQVCYHAVEAVLIADETTIDPATQINQTPINYNDTTMNYQTMQFANV